MLTQAEADMLIEMRKKRCTNSAYDFPEPGQKLVLPLVSENGREKFEMNIFRGRIRISKCNYAELGREVVMLVRLDIGGRPHHNPDGPAPLPFLNSYEDQEVKCPHIHIYVEGYEARWAIPAPCDEFTSLCDLGSTLDDFFKYCNVIEPPAIQRTLL